MRVLTELSNYIHTPTGKIIISALLGIGLSSIFRKICTDRSCMIYVGPTEKEMQGVYRWDGQCYKIQAEAVSCMPDKTILDFGKSNST